jgi:peptidoglycan hydrolase-like protein with peptidoglycan-binding domain
MNKLIVAVTIPGLLLISACSSTKSTPAQTSKPAPAVASATRDSSQSIGGIKDVQYKLAHQGFYHGHIDGVWGPATENALRSYQHHNNIPVTGKLDNPTMLMLHDTSNAP